MYAGQGPGDLAGHERLTTQWRLMIEEYAVAGVKAVSLAVVHRNPIGVNLSCPVRGTGVKRRGLPLRYFLDLTEHLRGRSLVEAGSLLQAQNPNGLQHPQSAHCV